jgi:hypothetical protein
MGFASGLTSGYNIGRDIGEGLQNRGFTRGYEELLAERAERERLAQEAGLTGGMGGYEEPPMQDDPMAPVRGISGDGYGPDLPQVPQAPETSAMSQEEYFDRRAGLAARFNRRDELRRTEDLRTQYQSSEEARRLADRDYQLRLEQSDQQIEQFKAQQGLLERKYNDFIAREDEEKATKTALDTADAAALNASRVGFDMADFEASIAGFSEPDRVRARMRFAERFAEINGVTMLDINKQYNETLLSLRNALATAAKQDDPEAQRTIINEALSVFNTNLTDGITPAIVEKDGKFYVQYGDRILDEYEGDSPKDLVESFLRRLDENPLESLNLVMRNQQAQLTGLEGIKTAEAARAYLQGILKSSPELFRDPNFASRALQMLENAGIGFGISGGLGAEGSDWADNPVQVLRGFTQASGTAEVTPPGIGGLVQSVSDTRAEEATEAARLRPDSPEVTAGVEATLTQLNERYGDDTFDSYAEKVATLRAIDQSRLTDIERVVLRQAELELLRQTRGGIGTMSRGRPIAPRI